jgi:hypothetical protein
LQSSAVAPEHRVVQAPARVFDSQERLQEIEDETVAALRSAVSTLQAKAPDDVQEYRDFVVEVAESVAKAADEIGATETDALEKIKAALQTTT